MLEACHRPRAAAQTRGYTASKDELQRRLARIEGQVRGVSKMVAEDRYCIDVLTQIAAIEGRARQRSRLACSTITRGCACSAARSQSASSAPEEMMAAVGRLMRRG